MARYNSVNSTGSVAGGNSITTPSSGLLTTLTGSGTVTVPNPVYYTGQIQTFYNSTLSAITLSTPSGNFIAPGFTSASSLSLPAGSIITLTSDGTNYIGQSWLGGIGSHTSLSASGGTVTLSGTTTGSIDNVVIGGTTAAAGTFNGLTNTAGTTSLAGGSASGIFSFTSNQASSATNNGAIVVTGGAGIGGAIWGGNGAYIAKNYSGLGVGNPLATFYGTDSGVGNTGISITTKGATSLYDTGSYPLQVWVNGVATASFRGDGNVGIGTSSPAAKLNVIGDIQLSRSATASDAAINFGSNLNNYIYSGNSTNIMAFATSGSERMRINPSGNVGIGTTSPTYPLVVNGATVASQFLPSGNPSIFSSVSAMGYSGVINWWSMAGDASTNSPGNVSYLPYIHWTNVQASYGYRQHTVLGSYRDGGADWGSAMIAVGGNDAYPTVAFTFDYGGNSHTPGTVYGGAKSFKIPHPHPDKEDTHNLVYASIESPSLDLLFRGEVTLVDGEATVNLDTVCKQTEGTFVNLCRQVQCFTTNESDWTAVKGRVDGNMLNIVTQDSKSTATISWMVIGQRKDKLAMALDLTDDNGELITEIIPRHVDKSNHAEILNPGQGESDLSTMMKNTPDQK
jgi:hypothetical protein